LYKGRELAPTSETLAPGQSTVFKLTSNSLLTGLVYDAQNGTASLGSNTGFTFFPSLDGIPAQSSFAISNVHGYSIPQVAVAWPSTLLCPTRRYARASGCARRKTHEVTCRCYSNSCDITQAIPFGETAVSAVARATSSCFTADTGITIYCTLAVPSGVQEAVLTRDCRLLGEVSGRA
jgi:hypothetical protein